MEETFGESEERCSMCNTLSYELIEAIGSGEIMKVCPQCARNNNIPIIRKPTEEQLKKAHRFYGVRERLYGQIIPHAQPVAIAKKSEEDRKIEKYLKETVKKKEYPELVDNFHWSIQQARRMKKISQKQLAEAIAEPEVMVELAEQGRLPDNYDRLVTKLEQYLKVKIRKQSDKPVENTQSTEAEKPEEFDINKANLFKVTTGYLKTLKEKWNKWGSKSEEDEIKEMAEKNKDASQSSENAENKTPGLKADDVWLEKDKTKLWRD